ncbi:MAG: hypothetical protein ABGX04_19445 [Myxococcales bacterium]|nr:hypothetical protein [Myxococcales bacterium]HIM02336.1 hypothetical protein [Myxococcales bacterium]
MSLKAFHIFFIVVSTWLGIGLGVWAIHDFTRSGSWMYLALGIGSLLGSAFLVWYGLWFLRKLKYQSYL